MYIKLTAQEQLSRQLPRGSKSLLTLSCQPQDGPMRIHFLVFTDNKPIKDNVKNFGHELLNAVQDGSNTLLHII